jgi:hypothetical protein
MKGIKNRFNVQPSTYIQVRHCEEPRVFTGDAAISGAVQQFEALHPGIASL